MQSHDGGRPFGKADEFRTFLKRAGDRDNWVARGGIEQCHDSGEAVVIKTVNAHQRAVTEHRYGPGGADKRLRIFAKRSTGYCINRHRVAAVRKLPGNLISVIARRGAILAVEQHQPHIIRPMTIKGLDTGGVDLHRRTSGCKRRAAAEQCQPRGDLAGDIARQTFECSGFGGDDGIVGTDTVDTDVGAGGSIEQHSVAGDINEAVAGTQCAAFAGGGIVATNAKGNDLVVKRDLKPIARVGRGGSEAVEQCLADNKALTIGDRCNFSSGKQRRSRADIAPRIDRGEIAGRKGEGEH